jgi:glucan phosphoethanolaminetransferase (alkaline phosphatase superfamily)
MAVLNPSDDGEPRGEYGLYPDATPLFLVPETQTQVPMGLSLDKSLGQAMWLDGDCGPRRRITGSAMTISSTRSSI